MRWGFVKKVRSREREELEFKFLFISIFRISGQVINEVHHLNQLNCVVHALKKIRIKQFNIINQKFLNQIEGSLNNMNADENDDYVVNDDDDDDDYSDSDNEKNKSNSKDDDDDDDNNKILDGIIIRINNY